MTDKKANSVKRVKKLAIAAAVDFAIEHVPGIDEQTLSKYLELINVTGNFGSVTEEELLEKMRLFRKYIPKSCRFSLQVLVDLLDLNAAVPQPQPSQPARLTYHNNASFLSTSTTDVVQPLAN